MFFCESGFSFFEGCHSGGRILTIKGHAAIGFSLKISEIQIMGLAGSGFKSCVGAAQIAFTNVGGSRLKRPENALHLSSFLNCDSIFRAGPRFLPHERIGVAKAEL